MTLPLSKTKTTLVIEQLNKNVPNDVHWHYGYLYQQCVKRGANADLYEIDYMITEEDFKEAILRAKDYEQIIVTNFYVRSRTANNEFIQKLQDELGNKVVVINNTPYKLSTPEGANNILTTLATTPENLKAVAGILFEGEKPEGVWPLGLTEEHVYV